MMISGITTPLSSLKRRIEKTCLFTSTSSPSACAARAIKAGANGRAASSGRRRMVLPSGSGRAERQGRDGARRQPLAVGFGPDEQQADHAARNQQGAQDDVAALVASER